MNVNPLLILDLDETLIHATEQPEREADFQIFHYHVYKRPYLEEFFLRSAGTGISLQSGLQPRTIMLKPLLKIVFPRA